MKSEKNKPQKMKYSQLIGRWVWCRWMDATRVDMDNLDAFLEYNKGKYNNYCKYKQMAGVLQAEDQYVIVLTSIFDEKNPNLPPDERSASVEQVPKEWVLEIRELDFVDCEEDNEEKMEPGGGSRTGETPGQKD